MRAKDTGTGLQNLAEDEESDEGSDKINNDPEVLALKEKMKAQDKVIMRITTLYDVDT